VYADGYDTKVFFSRSVIGGNRAVESGGGIWSGNGAKVYVSRSVIANNSVDWAGGGGGFIANGGSISFRTSTIVGNDAGTVGHAGRLANNGTVDMANCIVWANGENAFLNDGSGTLAVAYSDVQEITPGDGNINADPLFVNAAAGDFHLMAGSPCIDAGDPASPLDPDGTRADMGAFFFDKRTDPYHVGGTIETTSWPAGGTYHVIGNVFVQEGATLNIGAGTDVLFDADAQIHVYGELHAVGQEGSLIRFMPGTSPQWGGIRFWSGDNTLAYVEVTGVSVTSSITEIPQPKATRGSENGERLTRTERRAQLSNASRLRQAQAARAAGASKPSGTAKAAYTDNEFPVGALAVCGEGTSLDISNSSIHGNTANYGAGIYVEYYGRLTATSCTISDNHATDVTDWYYREGGGVAIYEAQAQFTTCTFTGNTADDEGGGAYVENYSIQAPVSFVDCVFSENIAEQYGGGAVEFTGGSLDLTNCTFTGNSAGETGGAVDAWKWEAQSAVATITGCEFRNNTAAQGGAVWVGYGAASTLTRSLFVGNTALPAGEYTEGYGGAVYQTGYQVPVTINNCTFVNNLAQDGSGGAVCHEGFVNIGNSILWGNAPDNVASFGEVTATINYSDVQGGWNWEGIGNISADPLFVDSAGGDFHLRVGSPCINAGGGEVANDPDGSPPDLGAFYFDLTGYVWGELAGTWTRGTYRVGAPVWVPSGATLTMEPGVDVLFDADVPLLVEGSLQALGEEGEGNGIRFFPGVAPEWGGLKFTGTLGKPANAGAGTLQRSAGTGEGAQSTLRYAEISGADADTWDPDSPMPFVGVMGGGMGVFGTSVEVSTCRIHGNQATHGGGLAAFEGSIAISASVVENNVANAGLGGSFVAVYGGLMANDTEFRNNTAVDTSGFFAGGGGGGGYVEDSYAILERCRFQANTSGFYGGGVMVVNNPDYPSPTEFRHCLFAGNAAAAGGGAYVAPSSGGGQRLALRLPDSLRVALAARPAAFARTQQEPGTSFVNCTFTGNTATGLDLSGGAVCHEGSVTIGNSILWGNAPDNVASLGQVTATINYSDVQGGWEWEGEGNINADPLFVDVQTADYRLTAYSPCVNTGDPAGAPDPNGTRADMGAFPLEFRTGDVTMDGTISGQDASQVLQFSVKLIPSIPFALADVTNNGRATALDAAMILFKLLRLSLGEDFAFPLDEGYYNPAKLAIPASPRTLTWERSGSAWELRADNPEGLMAGEFAFNVGSDVALSAEAGQYYATNRDGEIVRVAFARTDFTSPVLIRLVDDGRLLAPPSIASMELNEGMTPILRVVRPVEFALEQNTPNPFNPTTTIRFGLPVEGRVQLIVYDVTGRVVRTLVDAQMEAGVHSITWDGRDALGRDAASGTYIYRLVAPNGVLVKRMVMVK